jgi:uncharacterized protein YkwD
MRPTSTLLTLSTLTLTFATGCPGTLEGNFSLDGDPRDTGWGVDEDASVGGQDAGGGGVEDAGAPKDTGGGGVEDTGGGGAEDAGGEPDVGAPDLGPPDPCEGVSCGANSACSPATGACLCDGGFVPTGTGDCEAPAPGDPRARTAQEVCDRWQQDYPKRSTAVFTSSGAQCDAGQIDPEAHADAMRRVNLHRWLLGMEAATVDWGNQAKAQEAALMMDANGSLSHSPPMSWQCYTADGDQAAGASNLGLGYRHPADTVDGYMLDRNVPSLGHRRWVISPTLDRVGFGHHGRGAAMWVFGKNNANPVPDYVMYPGAGIMPDDAVLGDWSISSNRNIGTPTVEVTPKSGGAPLGLSVTKLPNNYGLRYAASIQFSDRPVVGETYVVTITLDDGTVWAHETTLVDCGAL